MPLCCYMLEYLCQRVSIGHANITTTQHTYLHIIPGTENKDNNKIINYLSRFVLR